MFVHTQHHKMIVELGTEARAESESSLDAIVVVASLLVICSVAVSCLNGVRADAEAEVEGKTESR